MQQVNPARTVFAFTCRDQKVDIQILLWTWERGAALWIYWTPWYCPDPEYRKVNKSQAGIYKPHIYA